MALAAGIEGRNSHQPVDAALRLEIAKGVPAGGGKGNAFDARLVAGLKIDDTGLEPFCLHPSQVHAEEHLGPVLGLGAAGAGIDGNDGIVPSSSPSSIISRENWCIRRPSFPI